MAARIWTLSLIIFVALLGASAATASNPCSSAVCQYIETVPTASGKVTPSVQKPKNVPVSKYTQRVIKKVKQPATKKAVNKIMRSTLYGAQKRHALPKKTAVKSFDPSVASSLSAALGSPGSGSGDRLVGLLTAVILITGVFVVAATRKQRSRNQL
jgi:hypothetical protein